MPNFCELYRHDACDCVTECQSIKDQRKNLLIEMMQEDEKNGMYEEPKQESQEDGLIAELDDLVAALISTCKSFQTA